jgi:hypothetical protein
MQKLHLLLLSYLFLVACHQAHPAAYLRRSTGNLITWPPAAWPAWPPWTLAATHAFHRASKAI